MKWSAAKLSVLASAHSLPPRAGAPAPVCVPTQGQEASGLGGVQPHMPRLTLGGQISLSKSLQKCKLLCVNNYFVATVCEMTHSPVVASSPELFQVQVPANAETEIIVVVL